MHGSDAPALDPQHEITEIIPMSTHVLKPKTVSVPVPLYAAGLLARGLYRYLSVSLEHDMRDDATYLLPATRITQGNPQRRLSEAKWKRAAFRWSFVGLPLPMAVTGVVANAVEWSWGLVGAAAPGWSALPWLEADATWLIGASMVWTGVGSYRVVSRYRRRETTRLEKRVASSITDMLGKQIDPARHVRLSPNYFHGDPWVEVTLPDNTKLDEQFRRRVVLQIAERLGFIDAQAEWHTATERIRVRVFPAATLPETVTWESCRKHMENQDVDHPLLGLGHDQVPVFLDFVQESPHSFVSGPSGTGKSTLYKALFAQRLRNGAGLVVLDWKASSAYDYLGSLPSNMVRVYDEVPQIAVVLEVLLAELQWRKTTRKTQRSFRFRKLDILVEEANSLREVLREEKLPEALAALGKLIFMGREFGMHVHFAAQRAEASVFGGTGSARRGSFQIRMMAQQDEATWKMLAPGIPYAPAPRGTRGIWTLVQGGNSFAHARVPFVSDEDALGWALEGAGEHLGMLTHGVILPDVDESVSMTADTEELLVSPPEEQGLVTLSAYAKETGDSLPALQAWVRRRQVEPAVQRPGRAGDLFRRADLESRTPTH